jgi:hypothetical protein
MKGKLPWMALKGTNFKEKNLEITKMKSKLEIH